MRLPVNNRVISDRSVPTLLSRPEPLPSTRARWIQARLTSAPLLLCGPPTSTWSGNTPKTSRVPRSPLNPNRQLHNRSNQDPAQLPAAQRQSAFPTLLSASDELPRPQDRKRTNNLLPGAEPTTYCQDPLPGAEPTTYCQEQNQQLTARTLCQEQNQQLTARSRTNNLLPGPSDSSRTNNLLPGAEPATYCQDPLTAAEPTTYCQDPLPGAEPTTYCQEQNQQLTARTL
ncbi:uncharacterized protein V6R79_018171 [Siganus canaliculatus]